MGDKAAWLYLVDATCYLVTNFGKSRLARTWLSWSRMTSPSESLFLLLLANSPQVSWDNPTLKTGKLWMKCVVYVSMILTQATLFVKLLRFYFTRVQHKYSFQAPLFGSCGCNSWSSDQKVAGFDPWACRMNGYYPPQWTEPGGQNKEEVTTNPFTYFAKWVAHAPVRQSDPDRQ